jgi:hypothetical protein
VSTLLPTPLVCGVPGKIAVKRANNGTGVDPLCTVAIIHYRCGASATLLLSLCRHHTLQVWC